MMTVKPNIILTNTRLAISIIAPLIMILYFFFQLQADTRVNAEHIERNMEAVSKMEGKVEKMEESMNTLVVDIRVMSVQFNSMIKTMERMEKKLEKL